MRINGNKEIEFKCDNSWIDKELKLPRAKRTIKALATMLLNGKVDYKVLGNLYRPDQKIPEATVKRFLKQSKVKHMVDKELEIALTSQGITKDYLIEKRKYVIDKSLDNDKLETMLKALSGFETMLGMDKQNKETSTVTQQLDYKQMIEIEGKKQTNHLTASQTKEIEPEQKESKNADLEQ